MPSDFNYGKIKRKIAVIEADMESACIQHGIRGHLQHEHIEQMIAEIPEEEQEARVHGRFAHLVGMVFKMFNRSIHVIKPFPITWSDYAVWNMLDNHPRTPNAVLWGAVSAKNQKFIIDDFFENTNEGELAEMIKSREKGWRVEKRLIDPSSDIVDQNAVVNSSLKTRLADKYGLVYALGSKDRDGATQRIKSALDYVKVGDDIEVPPEIYIFSTCERLIFELMHLQWDDWRGRTKFERNPKEKPKDKDDHQIENLGRFLLDEPEFILPSTMLQTPDEFKSEDPFD